jgi:hypothetical protein
MQAQADAVRNQLEEQRAQADREYQAAIEQMKAQANERMKTAELEFERWKTEYIEANKVVVAQIGAKSAMDQTLMAAEQKSDETIVDGKAPKGPVSKLVEAHGQTLEAINGLVGMMAKPKRLVRGADGRAVGVEVVT